MQKKFAFYYLSSIVFVFYVTIFFLITHIGLDKGLCGCNDASIIKSQTLNEPMNKSYEISWIANFFLSYYNYSTKNGLYLKSN